MEVVFVGPRVMRALNRGYRGKDYATDVLSFPYEGEIVDGLPFLGEIIIAPAAARDPMRKLLVHGILHLLGYDHEVDGGRMLRLQSRMLRKRSVVSGQRSGKTC
jgi:probable rRNA maturation factor